jgi:hypothetical protein
VGVGEAVLVHDPVGLNAPGRLAGVEDERLLDTRRLGAPFGRDRLIGPGGLPVPSPGCAVGARPVGVLAVPRREEVPLLVPEQRLVCTRTKRINQGRVFWTNERIKSSREFLRLRKTEQRKKQGEGADDARTWQFPRVELVEIDLGDDGHGQLLLRHLPAEVVDHQLLVRGVEPEPRRQAQLRLRGPCHPPQRQSKPGKERPRNLWSGWLDLTTTTTPPEKPTPSPRLASLVSVRLVWSRKARWQRMINPLGVV